MLTEDKKIDKIEILETGVIQIREATTIYRDGQEITKAFHRSALMPGQDVSNQPNNIQEIAAVTWTPEVVEKFKKQCESLGK